MYSFHNDFGFSEIFWQNLELQSDNIQKESWLVGGHAMTKMNAIKKKNVYHQGCREHAVG